MADFFSILSNSYKTAPTPSSSNVKYVPVDPALYTGTWNGAYSTGEKFSFSISDVQGISRQGEVPERRGARFNSRTC